MGFNVERAAAAEWTKQTGCIAERFNELSEHTKDSFRRSVRDRYYADNTNIWLAGGTEHLRGQD